MTEDEAKTKWCPMVRITATKGYEDVDNRGQALGDYQCIASDCMMWRLITGESGLPIDGERGYCGLGGKP